MPTVSSRISNATVTVMNGPDAGQSATTDEHGAFQLTVKAGQITLRAQAANYVESSISVSVAQSQTVTVALDPARDTVTMVRDNETITSDGNCPDWWSTSRPPQGIAGHCLAGYLINVHHAGTLTAELTWTDKARHPWIALYRSSGGLPSGPPLPSEPTYDTVLAASVPSCQGARNTF